MLHLFIIAKCFAFTGTIHVRVQSRSEPKSSSPQSSESAQCENTETPPLRSLMDLQRLKIFFPRLQIPEKVDMFTQFIRVVLKKLKSSLQLNCLKTSFVALLMER